GWVAHSPHRSSHPPAGVQWVTEGSSSAGGEQRRAQGPGRCGRASWAGGRKAPADVSGLCRWARSRWARIRGWASAALVAMVRRAAHVRRRSESMNAETTVSTGEVQLDNGIFRVTRWTIEPDGVIPMHRHDYEYVVVPMVTESMHGRNADGSSTVADLKA